MLKHFNRVEHDGHQGIIDRSAECLFRRKNVIFQVGHDAAIVFGCFFQHAVKQPSFIGYCFNGVVQRRKPYSALLYKLPHFHAGDAEVFRQCSGKGDAPVIQAVQVIPVQASCLPGFTDERGDFINALSRAGRNVAEPP